MGSIALSLSIVSSDLILEEKWIWLSDVAPPCFSRKMSHFSINVLFSYNFWNLNLQKCPFIIKWMLPWFSRIDSGQASRFFFIGGIAGAEYFVRELLKLNFLLWIAKCSVSLVWFSSQLVHRLKPPILIGSEFALHHENVLYQRCSENEVLPLNK